VPHASAASTRGIVASALNDLATTEARQEQFSLALAHFHEAEQWDPELPGLMRNVGLSAARVQDDKETIRALRPVVARNPEDRVARTLLGTALFSVGEYTEAVKVFTPLGDSALANFEVGFAWASSLAKTNKYVESSALLDQLEAHQLSPDNLLLLAQTWAQMANYSRTVSACHRALQMDPKLPRAHSIAGLALVREDKPADAEQEFRAELQLNREDIGSEYQLAFVLLQQAKTEEAVQHLKAVLNRQPEHPEANYELGKQLLADGEPAEAIPYLEAASRLKPQLEPVHYQLQAAYRAVGRKEDADREAKIYRQMKAKSRNITLPPPVQKTEAVQPQ
jgi:tetratricopeptide (TPR) repeat protein